jgi:hypothetical protein
VSLVSSNSGEAALLLHVRLHTTETKQLGSVTKLISAPDVVAVCWAWYGETAAPWSARGANAVLLRVPNQLAGEIHSTLAEPAVGGARAARVVIAHGRTKQYNQSQ